MIHSLTIFSNKQFQSLAISHLNTTLGMNLLVPILPVFLLSQGFSETKIGLIMGATAASALMIRPWVGSQTDIKGSRPIILIGQLLLILATIGYWWATTFWAFLSLRFLFGIAMAFYGTGAVTFASSIGSGDANANAIAIYTLITMLGFGFSMSIAQIAFDSLGFGTLVGMSFFLVGTALGVMKLRSNPITLSTADSTKVTFITVLKTKVVLAATLCQFATSFTGGAMFTFLPLASLNQGVRFFSLFFISFAISVIQSRFFIQKINDRLGLEKSSVYASISMLISVLLLFLKISPMVLLISGLLFGFGFGVVYPSLVLLLVKHINTNNRGTSLSILIASGDIGNAMSTALLGGVAEHLGYSALFVVTMAILGICTYYFYSISARCKFDCTSN